MKFEYLKVPLLTHATKQILGKVPELYVDVGCGHPVNGSNTHRFYRQGSRGLCIDANPKSKFIYRVFRSRDVFLHGGVKLFDKQKAHFYRFIEDVYSTFDHNRAKNLVERGLILKGVESVEMVDLRKMIGGFCKENPSKSIDLLDVDVEGLDLEVIKMFRFEITSPNVICIEEWDNRIHKRAELREFLESKGYILAGYSGISSIYSLSRK